jgi:hypothetical protein
MTDWRTLFIYLFSVFVGLILRYFQERKKHKKADFKYQLVTSLAVSYVMFIFYRDRKVTICSVELWLCFWSYFGSVSVTLFDDIFKDIFTTVLRSFANKILLITNKNSKKAGPHDNNE